MKEKLSLENLEKTAKKVGLRKAWFSHEIFFYALIYKELIWRLAHLFSPEKRNITNTEFILDENEESIKELIILVDFSEKNRVHEFGTFILQRTSFLPMELRRMMNFSAGFGYGNEEAITIMAKGISFITQKELDSEESDGSLTDEIIDQRAYAAVRKFRSFIWSMIN